MFKNGELKGIEFMELINIEDLDIERDIQRIENGERQKKNKEGKGD